jgi:hypothetical protein
MQQKIANGRRITHTPRLEKTKANVPGCKWANKSSFLLRILLPLSLSFFLCLVVRVDMAISADGNTCQFSWLNGWPSSYTLSLGCICHETNA